MTLPSAEQAAATRRFIKAAGGNATWDRLAEFLDETGKGKTSFVINRSFAAPIETVFDMWTDPDKLACWLPPAGFEMTMIRNDMRSGGSCFFRMSNSEGVVFHARFDYSRIERPRSIGYVQRFCDENENEARHPGMPEFPAALQTSVFFTREGEHGTRITVVSEIHGDENPAEVAAFRKERAGMTLGWSGSFDALEALLSRPSH